MSRELKWLVGVGAGVSLGLNVATFALGAFVVTRPSPPTVDPAVQLCRVVK